MSFYCHFPSESIFRHSMHRMSRRDAQFWWEQLYSSELDKSTTVQKLAVCFKKSSLKLNCVLDLFRNLARALGKNTHTKSSTCILVPPPPLCTDCSVYVSRGRGLICHAQHKGYHGQAAGPAWHLLGRESVKRSRDVPKTEQRCTKT